MPESFVTSKEPDLVIVDDENKVNESFELARYNDADKVHKGQLFSGRKRGCDSSILVHWYGKYKKSISTIHFYFDVKAAYEQPMTSEPRTLHNFEYGAYPGVQSREGRGVLKTDFREIIV